MKLASCALALIVMASLATVPGDARRRRTAHARRAVRMINLPAHRAVSDTGSCSCTSKKVCVGPRGGRYCMTSGGNKRYGV